MAAGQAAQGAGATASIAGRYADALFDLALEEGALETVETDLEILRAALEASPQLRGVFQSPIYDVAEQLRVVRAIAAKARLSALMTNFLSLVATNRRLFAFIAMIAAFRARLADHRGEVAAEAISAAPLSTEQTKRLRTEIESLVGKAVNLTARVDEALLGGLVVKIGSKMIDSSLRTKLNRMKSVMKEA